MCSDELIELAQRTQMQPTSQPPPDWEVVKASLGFDVPKDYKQLINLYGAGAFNNYIQLKGPEERVQYFNLNHEGLYWDRYFQTEWEGHPEVGPSRFKGRNMTILNWASTEDVHEFFWIAESGVAPEHWPIALFVMEGKDRWEFYQQSTVAFLLTFVKGELPSLLLPPYAPDELITYEPYPSYDDD